MSVYGNLAGSRLHWKAAGDDHAARRWSAELPCGHASRFLPPCGVVACILGLAKVRDPVRRVLTKRTAQTR